MRRARLPLLVFTLLLTVLWCQPPAPVAAGSEVWKLEEIVEGLNFFRHSNKTYHRHLRIVMTKKVYATSYRLMLEEAGHARLGKAFERAYLREAAAIDRANRREIHRVRHTGKNIVAFLFGRNRRTYNSKRAIRVLSLDKEVQEATYDRRLLEAQISSVLEKEEMNEAVKGLAGELTLAIGVTKVNYADMVTYDEKWIAPQTKKKLEATKNRIADNAAAASIASATDDASAADGEAASAKEPPPMVAASKVKQDEEAEPPDADDGTAPWDQEEAGEITGESRTAGGFDCAVDTGSLPATALPRECLALVDAAEERCVGGCNGGRACEKACVKACNAVRDECVVGFTCEISMSTLFGAGDRKECYDKVEAQRKGCLEDCGQADECEALCNEACDHERDSKCAEMEDVFTPQETRE
ncbi:MAG: hypothetical protein PVG92_04495 [Holophagae bacterium]|jgi:hypothetical protein